MQAKEDSVGAQAEPKTVAPDPEKSARFRELVKERAVFRSERQPIFDEYGNTCRWLMDMRPIFLDGESLDLATDLFWDMFAEFDSLQIAALELGAIPLIGALCLKGRQLGKNVNGLMVRRSRKKEGLLKRIEGVLNRAPVVIVDDLVNSGSSLRKVCAALRDEDVQPLTAFVFTQFRELSSAVKRELGVEVVSLFNLDDLDLHLDGPRTPHRYAEFETVWSFTTPLERPRFDFVVPKSNPLVDDTRVYFGTDARTLYALDARSGEKIWEHHAAPITPAKGIWSSPAISGERIFYGAYDGNLYCLNKASGAEIWVNSEADYIGSSPEIVEDLGFVCIGMQFGKPGRRGSFQALDLATGEKRWQYDVRELLHGSGVYSRRNKCIGFGTNDKTFIMLDARTGRELWMLPCQGPVKWKGSLGHNDDVIAFASHDGHVYVAETVTGKLVYKMRAEFSFVCAPLIVGDHVVAGNTDKGIYVGNYRTGKLVRRIETDARIFSSPVFDSGRVYIGNNSGSVFEIETGNWELTGRYDLPDRILSAIAVGPQGTTGPSQKLNYALTGDSRLFAFRRVGP